MAPGSTQPQTEMSTRNIYLGVKAAGAYGWQPYHLHAPIILKSMSLNLLEPSRPVQACNGMALLCTYVWYIYRASYRLFYHIILFAAECKLWTFALYNCVNYSVTVSLPRQAVLSETIYFNPWTARIQIFRFRDTSGRVQTKRLKIFTEL